MGKMKRGGPVGGGGFKINRPALPARPLGRPAGLPKISIPGVVLPRPAAVPPPRGANPNRIVNREVRREAFKQQATQQQSMPRFAIRPAASPLKIMPKQPIPQLASLPRPQAARPVLGAQTQRPKVNIPRPAAPPPGSAKQAQKPGGLPPPTFPPSGKQALKPPLVKPGGSITGLPRPGVQATAGSLTSMAVTAALSALRLNSAAAHPQIMMEASSLSYALENLRSRSDFSQIQSDVTELDANLAHTMNLLESARSKGYEYQKDLDEIAYQALDRWQSVRQQVVTSLPQQAAAFQQRLVPLSQQVSTLNSVLGNPLQASPLLRSTSSQVNMLLGEAGQIETSLQGAYAEVESQVYALNTRLNAIHWMLGQLDEAKFKLDLNEAIYQAVQARWDQVGEDDPEGILYLTNKRLIFERKEKVATKKVLFLTLAKELVQEVMIAERLEEVAEVKAINKGLFGNQDFLEVKFNHPKLREVPFHLNGQASEDWANWVRRAKSGEIDSDKVTGSGLSYADLSGPLTTADLMALQNEVNALQDVVTLKPVREEMASIENDMRSLERNLADLRGRGYLIEKGLEADVAVLATQWERIKGNVDITLVSQTKLLSEQMTSIQKQMAELAAQSGNLNAARPQYMQIKSAIASVDAQADAADDLVIAQYDQYAEEVETLTAHMEWVGWMLEALSTASFKLLRTESGVAAAEATWERVGFVPENGILFLTDQRLLWEDRVETIELKFNLPLQEVEAVQKEADETSGQEALVFSLSSSGPYPSVRFNLSLPVADAWLKMVGRARAGDYAHDRAEEIDPAELERIRNAPRQCPNCGAGLTAPILRGQTEITCEYCGQVIRI